MPVTPRRSHGWTCLIVDHAWQHAPELDPWYLGESLKGKGLITVMCARCGVICSAREHNGALSLKAGP